MKYSLLMTACIEPKINNVDSNFRADPSLRLNDYKKALRYWLFYEEDKIINIIFVENSGYDLRELREIVATENRYNRTVEFIQFEATPIPEGLHYGYSELEILDKAFDLSKTISETDSFIKVTGRLYFPSLSKLLKRISDSTDIVIDFKDYKFFNKVKRYAVSTLIVIHNDFYLRKLYGIKRDMNNGHLSHLETLYYEFLKPLSLTNKNIITRFPVSVDPVGVGAHWNKNYNSLSRKSYNFIRGCLRVLCPKLKI